MTKIQPHIKKRTIAYGWIVFLCSVCGITGIMFGWSVHKAIVTISGDNLGFIEFSYQAIKDFNNPYAFAGLFLSFCGLVLQAIKIFKGRHDD